MEAFKKIKHYLTNTPVLAFADPSKPYVLHVDASLSGLGAVLYQEHSEGLRPVAFASRKLSSSEKNYPSTTSAKLNATGHRWLLDLSAYDFDIIYRPGRENVDADLLSRMEPREWETEWQSVSQDGVKSICQRVVELAFVAILQGM